MNSLVKEVRREEGCESVGRFSSRQWRGKGGEREFTRRERQISKADVIGCRRTCETRAGVAVEVTRPRRLHQTTDDGVSCASLHTLSNTACLYHPSIQHDKAQYSTPATPLLLTLASHKGSLVKRPSNRVNKSFPPSNSPGNLILTPLPATSNVRLPGDLLLPACIRHRAHRIASGKLGLITGARWI